MGDILDDWFGIEPSKPPKTPAAAAPDPAAAANAQYQYNSQAAKDSAYLNAIDQYGPYGSTVFARRPDGTPYAQSVNLDPRLQGNLDSQLASSTKLNQAALQQLGYLPGNKFQLPNSPTGREYASEAFGEDAIDPSRFADPLAGGLYQSQRQALGPTASTDQIAQDSYAAAKALFEPDLEAARKQKEIQLANRGISPGDQIWNDEMGRLDRQADQAYSGAARQARLDSGQEQSRQFGQNLSTAQYGAGEDSRLAGADLSNRQFLGTTQNQQYNQLLSALGYGNNAYQQNLSNVLLERQQPLAEFGALMGSSPQFQQPSFMNTAALNVQSPNYLGVVNQNSANAASMYNSAVAGMQKQDAANASAFGNIAGNVIGTVAGMISDEDMKENRRPADGEEILESFREMPMENYDYRQGAREAYDLPESRTGTMAQDYAREFGGDGKTIDIGDWMGKLTAAMMALDKKVSGGKG